MSLTMQRGMRMRMNLPRVVLIGILLLVTNVLNFQLPRADPSRPTMARARDEGVGEVGEAQNLETIPDKRIPESPEDVASVNTFKGCLDTIDVSRPDWIALENVEAIDREGPDDSSESNLKLCVDELESRGYTVECMLLDSEWYGLPQGRRRVYIVGINLKSSEISLSGNKFFQNIQTILRAMYIKAPPVDSLLLKEDDEAVVAYYEHLAELASNKTDDAQGAWTSLHMGVAEKRGIQWPLQVPKVISASKWFDKMTPRTQEVIAFAADEKYRLKKAIKFADVYHSANRYSTGGQSLPVVLPRSITWSFQRQRPLLGRELLRCQGLCYHATVLEPFTESQLGQLAGNAFAGNVILAVDMGVLASIRYTTPSEKSENEDIADMVAGLGRI